MSWKKLLQMTQKLLAFDLTSLELLHDNTFVWTVILGGHFCDVASYDIYKLEKWFLFEGKMSLWMNLYILSSQKCCLLVR